MLGPGALSTDLSPSLPRVTGVPPSRPPPPNRLYYQDGSPSPPSTDLPQSRRSCGSSFPSRRSGLGVCVGKVDERVTRKTTRRRKEKGVKERNGQGGRGKSRVGGRGQTSGRGDIRERTGVNLTFTSPWVGLYGTTLVETLERERPRFGKRTG